MTTKKKPEPRLPGDPAVKRALFPNVGPREFPSLVADVLATQGHTDIHVLDGPGDGQRDIQSRAPNGEQHIVQCKFKEDSTAALSAQEAGELVVALLKFGTTSGLLATNARLSPQAKREFLDAYPGYNLKYWEGPDLVNHVLASAVLPHVWMNKRSPGDVSHKLRLSFVVRLGASDAHGVCPAGEVKSEHFRGRIAPRHTFARSLLEPFRQVSSPGMLDLANNEIRGQQVTVEGFLPLHTLSKVVDELSATIVRRAVAKEKTTLAVRFGPGEVLALDGQIATHVGTPFTLWSADGAPSDEMDWFFPGALWQLTENIHVREAHLARWVGPDPTLLLELALLGPDEVQLAHDRLVEAERTKFWNASQFALTTADYLTEAAPKLRTMEPPDHIWPLAGGLRLLAWFQPGWLAPFVSLKMGTEPHEPSPWDMPSRDLSLVAKLLLETGLSPVGPTEARHLAASVDESLRDKPEVNFHHTAMMASYGHRIASPFNMRKRVLGWNRAWKVPGLLIPSEGHYLHPENIDGFEFRADKCGLGNVLAAYLGDTAEDCRPTAELVAEQLPKMQARFAALEVKLVELYGPISECTKEYWEHEFALFYPTGVAPANANKGWSGSASEARLLARLGLDPTKSFDPL